MAKPLATPATVSVPTTWKGPPDGWLGFSAVAPGVEAKPWWLPTHPDGNVVLFDLNHAPSGLVAIGPAGRVRLTPIRRSSERYGCEENKKVMNAFAADGTVAPGLLWVLRSSSQLKPISVPLKEIRKSKKLATWTTGHLQIELRKITKLKANLSVTHNGQRVHNEDYETYAMDGGEEDPEVDLESYTFGLPMPVAAFRVDDYRRVVVFHYRGYEGNSFKAMAIDPKRGTFFKAKIAESLYFCAF